MKKTFQEVLNEELKRLDKEIAEKEDTREEVAKMGDEDQKLLILGDIEDFKEAKNLLKRAIEAYERAKG